MKAKILILSMFSLFFLACAKETTREIDGEFLYIADAAVIKGDNFIYGVKVDQKMMELADQVKKYKKDNFDMIPVKVEGILSEKEKGAEGWDTIVEIKKIISITPATAQKPTKKAK